MHLPSDQRDNRKQEGSLLRDCVAEKSRCITLRADEPGYENAYMDTWLELRKYNYTMQERSLSILQDP